MLYMTTVHAVHVRVHDNSTLIRYYCIQPSLLGWLP